MGLGDCPSEYDKRGSQNNGLARLGVYPSALEYSISYFLLSPYVLCSVWILGQQMIWTQGLEHNGCAESVCYGNTETGRPCFDGIVVKWHSQLISDTRLRYPPFLILFPPPLPAGRYFTHSFHQSAGRSDH